MSGQLLEIMAAQIHVWIVDDDPVFRMIFSMMLTKLDGRITSQEYEHGEFFLTDFQKALNDNGQLPHFVFLDLNMPYKNGWEVLEILQNMEVKPEVTIYMLSSSINPEDEAAVVDYPSCSGFLVKPIGEVQLRSLLLTEAE